MTRWILLLMVVVAASALTPACGGGSDERPPDASPAEQSVGVPEATASASPAGGSAGALRTQVRRYAARMMADIRAAEIRGDVIDGVPVGESDNPYDYVGVSPVFVQLVALGRPALPAIAAEVEASTGDGLREYLLAAAGAQISGDTPGGGAQSWGSGKEWAQQYREQH